MVPKSVLSKMGEHEVEIEDGVQLTVQVLSDPFLIDNCIGKIVNSCLHYRPSPVVGFDCRGYSTFLYNIGVIVICLSNNFCLVAQLKKWATFHHLNRLFKEAAGDGVTLVGVDVSRTRYFGKKNYKGINAGELAAKVCNKPNLFKSTNLAEIAPEVGIDYVTDFGLGDRPAFDRKKESYSYWKNMVFSDDELKALVYDAYMCCKIGRKLLGE